MTFGLEWQRAYGKFASVPDNNSRVLMWNPEFNQGDPVAGEYINGVWDNDEDFPPVLWAYINMPTRAEQLAAYEYRNFDEDDWRTSGEPFNGQEVTVILDYGQYAEATYQVTPLLKEQWFVKRDGERLPAGDYAWRPDF